MIIADPVFLYIFGKLGGPFKVGYSKSPHQRARAIANVEPGYTFSGRCGVMWEMFKLPDQETAKRVERDAHKRLSDCQIPGGARFGYGHGYRRHSEWFDADLAHIRRMVSKAVARYHPIIEIASPSDR